jgi:hypothetical protein
MRPLTTDLDRGDARPYFLWDEDVTVDELRARLRGADGDERLRLLGKMLREARDIDVWRFVARFFRKERGFFLTGGAALAGYYLGHRSTNDLDLFTLDDEAFERGRFVLADVARELEAGVEARHHAPGFERWVVRGGDDSVVIDVVRERAPQVYGEKVVREGVRLDPVEEILANKLTTLLSRAEERDLVDVLFLERAGYRVEDAIPAAMQKDGGFTPATLAWLLLEARIPEGAKLPAEVSVAELQDYVEALVRRLRRAAVPPTA